MSFGSQNLPIMPYGDHSTKDFDFFFLMLVSGTPGYVPPVANFDGESTDGIILSSTAPVNKAKKGNNAQQKIFHSMLIKPNTKYLRNCQTDTCYLDGTGKKRKAPSKNSSGSGSQLEEATEADKTQQVNLDLSH